MTNELILWAALAVLIALMVLAVWAGRKGLHSLGVVGPGKRNQPQEAEMVALVEELRRLNANLEKLIDQQDKHPEP